MKRTEREVTVGYHGVIVTVGVAFGVHTDWWETFIEVDMRDMIPFAIEMSKGGDMVGYEDLMAHVDAVLREQV